METDSAQPTNKAFIVSFIFKQSFDEIKAAKRNLFDLCKKKGHIKASFYTGNKTISFVAIESVAREIYEISELGDFFKKEKF